MGMLKKKKKFGGVGYPALGEIENMRKMNENFVRNQKKKRFLNRRGKWMGQTENRKNPRSFEFLADF